MDHDVESLTCPFCDYRESNDYQMLLHVEVFHSESGDSPFAVKDEMAAARQLQAEQEDATDSESSDSIEAEPGEIEFVSCPHKCGEQIPAHELQFHTDLHFSEGMATEEATIINTSDAFSTEIDSALRHNDEIVSKLQGPSKRKWTVSLKEMFTPPSKLKARSATDPTSTVQTSATRRLGKAELGPYAHEKRMPSWLIDLLEKNPEVIRSNRIGHDGQIVRVEMVSNETPNLVPVLARLSYVDKKISRAFYCDPAVRHVAKLPREGGFCGYRNVQMLISYIRDAQAPGFEHFKHKRLPGILKLQNMIENAWDEGYNAAGREETGGIFLTRKYIGTPEAQALFLSLKIAAEAQAFTSENKLEAYTMMIEAVCKHFDDGSDSRSGDKVIVTNQPPLYFQYQGHSMTIVGVEIDHEGKANLIVFDPMYNPAKKLKDLALNNKLTFVSPDPEKLLKAHRRDEKYLGRRKAFEIIKVNRHV